MNSELIQEIIALVDHAKVSYVSSINEYGYPNTKAMLSLKNEAYATYFFSTNTSSKRVQQFINNPNACIYFCNEADYMGLMLVGKIEVTRERKLREMLWFDGCEMYYPKGIDDEDYSVFKFTAEWGNYYHGLQNNTFTIRELLDSITAQQ